jgi:hypothetical protein
MLLHIELLPITPHSTDILTGPFLVCSLFFADTTTAITTED